MRFPIGTRVQVKSDKAKHGVVVAHTEYAIDMLLIELLNYEGEEHHNGFWVSKS